MKYQRFIILPACLGLAVFFSGCSLLGGLTEIGCGFIEDSAHCYQAAAIQSSSADTCDKIKQPEQFKDAGSNPPQDKCYYNIAGNTGEAEVCTKIQGGLFSYEKDDCVSDVAVKTEDYSDCSISSAVNECLQPVIDKQQQRVEDTLAATNNGATATPQQIQQVQADMDKLAKVFESMSSIQQAEFNMNMTVVRNLR